MQIGNIDWKQIRLETLKKIGNNRFRLETKKETILFGLETKNVDWKHKKQIGNKKKDIGNNILRLETQGHMI